MKTHIVDVPPENVTNDQCRVVYTHVKPKYRKNSRKKVCLANHGLISPWLCSKNEQTTRLSAIFFSPAKWGRREGSRRGGGVARWGGRAGGGSQGTTPSFLLPKNSTKKRISYKSKVEIRFVKISHKNYQIWPFSSRLMRLSKTGLQTWKLGCEKFQRESVMKTWKLHENITPLWDDIISCLQESNPINSSKMHNAITTLHNGCHKQ